jgi:LacI family transcriptional regulator
LHDNDVKLMAFMTGETALSGGQEKMRPTMMDVAQAAGVSLKTVSRVVNGEQGVKATTLLEVQKAISELGYRRNDYARALRQDRVSRMLGLVTKDVSNPFYSAIARGVEEEVRDRDLLVVAGSSDEDVERERTLLEVLCERRMGGLLVVPTGSDHSFLASELAAGTPIVFIDRPPCHLAADSILLDNVGGAQAAVEHLLAHGHRRIALVGDLPEVFTASERVRGYRTALRSAGLPVDETLVRLGCHDSESAEAAVRELLALPAPPTAVFAGNNRITFGVLRALAGLEDRPALVGFDDFEFAPLLSPPVSVVGYDPTELGRQAARLICERLAGASGPPRQIVVSTKVIPRGSGETRPPAHQGS